jgi:spore maturation protein CgeB
MKAKIAYIDKHRAARNGQHRMAGPNLKFFMHRNGLESRIGKYKPDLVFINKGDHFTDIDFIQNITANYRTAYWFGDWRATLPGYMYDWAAAAGLAFFNAYDPSLFFELKNRGQKNAFVTHQGADTDIFKPIDNVPKIYDVGYGANFYGLHSFPNSKLRLDIIDILRVKGYTVGVVGNGWPPSINTKSMGHKDLNKFYNQCRVTIGISHHTDVKYAVSNRIYQCMAVGVPHINWHSPGVEELFDDGYVGVQSTGEMISEIDYLIKNKNDRQKLGQIQREQILNKHTYLHAWQRMERKIKQVYPELN